MEIGVLKGVSEGDLAGILSVAKPGLAGWNSRIAYSGGSWKPYYETGNPYLKGYGV